MSNRSHRSRWCRSRTPHSHRSDHRGSRPHSGRGGGDAVPTTTDLAACALGVIGARGAGALHALAEAACGVAGAGSVPREAPASGGTRGHHPVAVLPSGVLLALRPSLSCLALLAHFAFFVVVLIFSWRCLRLSWALVAFFALAVLLGGAGERGQETTQGKTPRSRVRRRRVVPVAKERTRASKRSESMVASGLAWVRRWRLGARTAESRHRRGSIRVPSIRLGEHVHIRQSTDFSTRACGPSAIWQQPNRPGPQGLRRGERGRRGWRRRFACGPRAWRGCSGRGSARCER